MTKDSAANKGFSLPFARVALILAALVALAAIAIAAVRSRADSDSTTKQPPAAKPVGDVGSMITGLEKKLAENPTDPQGWNLMGQAYYHVGRYADAVKAYSRAVALDSKNAVSWSALGEVQLLAGPGGITPEAEASFRKALAIDPKDFRARYFMAVMKDDKGDHKGAVDDLIAILRESPADAPWLQPVRDLTLRISTQHKIDVAGRMPAVPAAQPASAMPAMPASGGDSVATAGIPGPTSADLKAASAMTPSQQDEMARGMVARLAARLEQEPRDANRWIMLMRARMVLNDPAGAREALDRAKTVFRGDAEQIARFDDAAKTLGLPGR